MTHRDAMTVTLCLAVIMTAPGGALKYTHRWWTYWTVSRWMANGREEHPTSTFSSMRVETP